MTETPIEPTKCPNCGHSLSYEVMTKIMDDSRVSFSLHPHEGELLSAKTVGGALENIEGLFVSVGKELGAKTSCLVEDIQFDRGSVTIKLLLARHDPGIKKRKRAQPPEQRPDADD